jgi:hypothetical protein
VPDPHGNPAQEPGRLEGAQELTHQPLFSRSRARNLACPAPECGQLSCEAGSPLANYEVGSPTKQRDPPLVERPAPSQSL